MVEWLRMLGGQSHPEVDRRRNLHFSVTGCADTPFCS